MLNFTMALHCRDSRAPSAGPEGVFVAGPKTRVYIETEHSIHCAPAGWMPSREEASSEQNLLKTKSKG